MIRTATGSSRIVSHNGSRIVTIARLLFSYQLSVISHQLSVISGPVGLPSGVADQLQAGPAAGDAVAGQRGVALRCRLTIIRRHDGVRCAPLSGELPDLPPPRLPSPHWGGITE